MNNDLSYDEENELSPDELEKRLEEFAPYIGRLVISFNALEESVDSILSETINERDFDMGYIIIADMTFYSKVNLLNNLYRHFLQILNKQSKLRELNDLCMKMRDRGRKRNEFVHAAWIGIDKNSSVITRIKIRKSGISHVSKKMDTDQIDKEIATIEQVTDELWSLYDEAYAAIFSKKS